MPKEKYREHLQMIEAVQNKGTNQSELEEFAPGLIVVQDGEIFIKTPAEILLPINITDWLINDPGIGYIIPITDLAFQCRFSATPQ